MSASGQNRKTTKEKTRIDWETPPAVFLPVQEALGLTLDVATSGPVNSRCRYFYQGPCWGKVLSCQCGLCSSWNGYRAWCNPPYGPREIQPWVDKAIEESDLHRTVSALLLPNSTENGWFADLWDTATDIVFLEGRVPFVAPPGHEDEGQERSENTGGSLIAVYGDTGHGRSIERPWVHHWRWKVNKSFPVRA